MNASEIGEEVAKRLLPGEYVTDVEVTDDLVHAEIDVSIQFLEGVEQRTDRLIVEAMHVEDAAARLFAYLERRAG